MVHAAGTPKRHPESGIFFLRKRVPDRLRALVGKREIKISLRTRDLEVARIRNLEVLLRIAREWAQFDGVVVDQEGNVTGYVEVKATLGSSVRPVIHAKEAPRQRPENFTVPPKRHDLPLRRLFDSYAEEAQLSPATVKRWAPLIERFTGHLGHGDARAIVRQDVVAWKDSLLGEGISNLTVRDAYLASVRATLQFGVDQGQLEANVAAGVRVRVRKALQEREKGFDAEEAATILRATLRKQSGNASPETVAARRWIPWICAYTGARVNEITPLTGRDFVVRAGIPMIRIRAQTSKTRKFREVALHPDLIEQGLLLYAKSRGARPLFHDPGRCRGGKASNPHFKKVGERLAQWVRSLGVDPRVAPNHGWRHRFTSVARFVTMPEDVRHAIQGHASSKVADKYGDTWPQVFLREIEKLPRYLDGEERD
jgi:integrase